MLSISRRGFTLAELMIVIGTIGILSGIVITAVNPRSSLVKADQVKMRETARQIQVAINTLYIDSGNPAGAEIRAALSTLATPVALCAPGVSSEIRVFLPDEGGLDTTGCLNIPLEVLEIVVDASDIPLSEENSAQTIFEISQGDDDQLVVAVPPEYLDPPDDDDGGGGDDDDDDLPSETLWVYWGDKENSRIARYRADGTGPIEIVYTVDPNVWVPFDLEYNPTDGYLYVVNGEQESDSTLDMYRGLADPPTMPLTDSSMELFIENTKTMNIELDQANQIVYLGLVNPNDSAIPSRAHILKKNLPVPSANPVMAVDTNPESNLPVGDIAVDSANGRIYWLKKIGANSYIYSRPLGGGGTTLFPTPIGQRIRSHIFWGGLEVNSELGLLCWPVHEHVTNPLPLKISCSHLDGSGAFDAVTGLGDISQIEIDATNSRIYWNDTTNYSIQSARLSGLTNDDIVTIHSGPGVFFPQGLELVTLPE